MSEFYGTPPDWRVEEVAIDEQGAISLVIARPWNPVVTESGGRLSLPEIPPAPAVQGYDIGPGRWRRTKDGGFSMTYELKGVDPSYGGGADPDDFPQIQWSMSGSLYQRFIKTNPNWEKLKNKYSWDDGKKEFAEQKPFGTDGTNYGLNGDGQSSSNTGTISEMYGVTSYDDYSARLTKSYLTPDPDASLLDRINRIIEVPWARLGKIKDRNWKIGAPSFESHGKWCRNSETYELSGPGGWNPDLYEKLKK